jgi:hypothetical protein
VYACKHICAASIEAGMICICLRACVQACRDRCVYVCKHRHTHTHTIARAHTHTHRAAGGDGRDARSAAPLGGAGCVPRLYTLYTPCSAPRRCRVRAAPVYSIYALQRPSAVQGACRACIHAPCIRKLRVHVPYIRKLRVHVPYMRTCTAYTRYMRPAAPLGGTG